MPASPPSSCGRRRSGASIRRLPSVLSLKKADASRGDSIETRLEIAFAPQPNDLVRHLPLAKQQQRRNRPDAIFSRQLLVLVDVYFADPHLTIVFLGQLVQDRRDHL